MSIMDFCIPARDEDLLEVSDKYYYVSDLVTDVEEIDKAQNRFQSYVNRGEFEQIPEFFDAFFTVARHNDDVSFDQRMRIFETLTQGLSNFTGTLRTHVGDVMSSDALTEELNELNAKYANCLLMYFYLLSRISHHLESYVVKKSKTLNAGQKNNKKGGEQIEDYIVNFWNSCDGRLLLLRLIYGVVIIDAVATNGNTARAGIKFLWTPNIINEQLISCIIKTVMKVLENSEASKSNGKNILIAAFHVIRAMCVGWDQNRAVARSLMELAPRLDFFSQQGITHFPFIDVIPIIQVKDEMEPLMIAMIAYVGNFDMDSLMAKGEVSARVFSLFISTLSEKFPRLLFKNVAHIVPFLSFDPPSLRNSVLTAFTEIVMKCFDEQTATGLNAMNMMKQKRTMLFRLQDHIMDTSALVRTKALNLWTKLALKCAIPVDNFRLLLVRVVGDRLKDNSIMVRKAAITLLTAILSHNIFSSNLCFKKGLAELNDLRKKQAELHAKNPEFETIRNANRKFDAIEGNIQEIIKMCLDEFVLSDNLPSTDSVARDFSSRTGDQRFSSVGFRNDNSQLQENDEVGTQRQQESQSRTQEVLNSYNIATMIMNAVTRVEGCLEYLKLAMKQNAADFSRDMDIDEMVLKLSNNIRELLLQQGVAHKIRDDDQVLLEEDRMENFCQQVFEIDTQIERIMDKLFFTTEVEKCMPKATYCIKFGQTSEMNEMIRFICECCKFKIRGAQSELKKIFHLIWRKDTAITELIIEAGYDALFSKNSDLEIASNCTAFNLMAVMSDANEEERISLEETLVKIISVRELSDQILGIFWKTAEQQENLERRLVAVRLLAVIARAQKHRICPDLARLTRLYRTRTEMVRIEVLRVVAALAINSDNKNTDLFSKSTFRIPSSDKLIKSMFAFLVSELNSEQHALWVPHCREVVNVVYGICCRPYSMISSFFSRLVRSSKRSIHQHNLLLSELNKAITRFEELKSQNWLRNTENSEIDANAMNNCSNDPSASSLHSDENDEAFQSRERIAATAAADIQAEQRVVKLRIRYLRRLVARSGPRWELSASRLLYFVGEVALKFLTYLEVVFTREIKTDLQLIHEVRIMDTEEREMLKLIEFDIDKDTPLIQFERDCIKQRGFFEKADREDDRIGLTAISEEEKLQLKLQKVLDRDTFSSSTINGRILPFVVLILKSHSFISEQLKESAIACLAKLMLVNRKCCDKFLPLFFNFYESASVRLRNNMIIMMTDLCFRFPNAFNKFNDEYIKKIHDKNSGIRYTCLLVLSHMLLNDLIKVSGRIADLAPCLCDEDKNIAILARGFFNEISKKHNVLYNTMPDIISKLTTNRELTTKKFEEVIRFLFQFLTKDQHKESLIEKICQRFQLLKTHHAGGNSSLPEALAFCVNQIPLNERCFRKLTDGLRFYQEFLRLPQVYRHFSTALGAFKKASAKSLELKAQIEEFEQSLESMQMNES